MSFGETLYQIRKERNLSQEELANELNTSRQAVSKWENDQGFPEMDKLLKMSNLFDVSVDFLLKGELDGMQKESGKTCDIYTKNTSTCPTEKIRTGKNWFTFWNIAGTVLAGIAVLAFLYMLTGSEGHIVGGIDKFLSKL